MLSDYCEAHCTKSSAGAWPQRRSPSVSSSVYDLRVGYLLVSVKFQFFVFHFFHNPEDTITVFLLGQFVKRFFVFFCFFYNFFCS